jgi:hypothetical protein
MLIALRWRIQLHAERRQPLTGACIGQACVALVVPQLQQVLRIEPTAEFLGKLSGVLGGDVESEQAVEV